MMKLPMLISAAALCACAAAGRAEVSLGTPGNYGNANNARSAPAQNFSGAPDAAPTAGEDIAKDLPSESKLLNDHLRAGEVAGKSNGLRALNPKPGPAAAATPTGGDNTKAGTANSGDIGFDALKEGVKPIAEQVLHSEMLQTVREFDANVTGSLNRAMGAEPGSNPGEAAAINPVSTRVATSAEHAQREKIASDQAMQQLINEIKPLAFGVVGLLVLGYLALVVWNFLAWRGKRRSKRRRTSGGSRRGAETTHQASSTRRALSAAGSGSGRREHRRHRTAGKPGAPRQSSRSGPGGIPP